MSPVEKPVEVEKPKVPKRRFVGKKPQNITIKDGEQPLTKTIQQDISVEL